MARSGVAPNTFFDCEVCGDPVERYVTPSRVGEYTSRFCGRTCAGEWRKGANHPRWKGGRKVDADGYVYILRPDHPMATGAGYIYEHRLVMEAAIGRYLRPEEVVHHEDENPANNDLANLKLFATQAEHKRYHEQGRVRDDAGRYVKKGTTMVEDQAFGNDWAMYLGDSAEVLHGIPDDSVHMSIFSPPFSGMYVYTDSPRDVGNSATMEELIDHYAFVAAELLRVLMPGRTCAVHLTQANTKKMDGLEVGLLDFRGAVIRIMQAIGWTFYGEVTIDKNPQVKAVRTKDRGLLFKSLATDSANMRMAQADYLLQFRKPGENPHPIRAGISEKYANANGWITAEEWITWAAPVWYRATDLLPDGIRETDVLNVSAARDEKDERHLCPLQLGVIERAVKLWSAPGEIVLSPFGGVGSEGYEAIRHGRRYVGIELKRSYWETACNNLARASAEKADLRLAV